ncbi:MAG: BsuPI-related putative proteinase inhibitor [Acidobacteria bacterium]|nr:BsuPI-related putative proteinase inhibitor [Acidobacteriota bacterium]
MWLSLALPGFAGADPDYFPLQVGNTWVYRIGGATQSVETLEIERWGWIDDRIYYLLRSSAGGQSWVRMSDSGTLWAWDSNEKTERVLAAFNGKVGDPYTTAMNPCNRTAVVTSRNEKHTGPIGEFDWALSIRYAAPVCSDAGLDRELYLPWIGLIYRLETTIAGPRRWDLIYARLGGITVISEKEVAFGLSLDKAVYTANLMPPVSNPPPVPLLTALIHFRVVQDQPLMLTFGSGQTYDLIIKDEKGQVVYRWSDGRAFTMIVRQESFGPGEKTYPFAVPLSDKDGQPLPQGNYTAEAWLTTVGQKAYSASVAFAIRHLN